MMSEAGNEVVEAWILNHDPPARATAGSLKRLALAKSAGVGRGTPQEIGQSHRQFKIV